jgi:hypothetical protein
MAAVRLRRNAPRFFRRHRLNAALLVATLLLSACTHRPEAFRHASWQTTALGLCEDYPEESRSLARAEADLALARSSGATHLRIAFGWDAMEAVEGTYDWSFWDRFVPLAVDKYRLRLIPYVCYTPRWAARDQGENFWRSPPRDPAAFGRFMNALVSRYSRWIRTWELWNEPDNPAYWSGTTAELAALVHAGSAAIRSADARARVVLGGIAWNLDYLEELFRLHRIAPAVDVVNVHSYFETWHASPIEHLPQYLRDAAAIVREHGENEPLWMAETGYSSTGSRRKISEVYATRFRDEHTPIAQANALARTLLLSLASQQLELLAWYRINDLAPAQDVIGDDNNRHLGLVSVDGDTKPARAAFELLSDLFGQPYRIFNDEHDLLVASGSDPLPDDLQVHVFALQDGRHLVAAWLGLPAPGAAVSEAELTDDARRLALRVRLPGVRADRVRVVTATGVPAESAAWSRQAAATELHLVLRGSEVQLAIIDKPVTTPRTPHRFRPRLQPKFSLPRVRGPPSLGALRRSTTQPSTTETP